MPRDEALRRAVARQRANPPPGRFPDGEALRVRFTDEDRLLATLETGSP